MNFEIKELIHQIDEHLAELDVIKKVESSIDNKDNNKLEFIRAIANDAYEDAKQTIIYGYKIINSYRK
jgi:hypothetical protein